MSLPEKTAKARDFRRASTSVIWGCATGMLAICLSLTNAPHQGDRGTVISLAILVAATISTVAVWRSREEPHYSQETDKIRELKERIATLETIASSGELEWQRQSQAKIKDTEDRGSREAL